MYTEIVLEISIDGYRCDDDDDDDESRGFHSIIVCGIFRVHSSNRRYIIIIFERLTHTRRSTRTPYVPIQSVSKCRHVPGIRCLKQNVFMTII